MYVAVKGGERAIENAHRLLAHERRGDREVPEVSLAQISEQLSLGVARHQAGARRHDRGDFPAARLPGNAAAVRRDRAGRYREYAGAPPDFLDLQGYSGRPDSRPHLRLHPSPAGLAIG